MKCLTVTESELKNIGLANIGVTVCVGIGSALIAMGVDITKDLLLADRVPAQAQVLADAIRPLCLGFGAIFYLIAIIVWIWRKSMIDLIRQESSGDA